MRNDDFIIIVGFPITFTRWNHTWPYIFIIPLLVCHVSRHAGIFLVISPCRPLSLWLAVALETTDYGRAAVRMQRRRVGAWIVIIDGIDLLVRAVAGRRRAPVKGRNETVVLHAAFLDTIQGGVALDVVELRTDEPDVMKITNMVAKRAVPFKLESVTMLVMNIPEVSLFIL